MAVTVGEDYSHSIKRFELVGGPSCGVGGDDTDIMTRAAAAQHAIFFPPGIYGQTAPVTTKTGPKIEGCGYEKTRIARIGKWDGPSLRFGNGAKDSAGEWLIRNLLIEQQHPDFVWGESTPLAVRLDHDQALVEIYGGNGGRAENVWTQYGVFGFRQWGGARCRFDNITSQGIWDPDRSERQETKATIAFPYDPYHGFATRFIVEGGYLGGGNAGTPSRWQIGTVLTDQELRKDAGSRDGVIVEACELGQIRGNYIGGCGRNLVRVDAKYICTSLLITENEFDGSSDENICLKSYDSVATVNDVRLIGNDANGQMQTREFLRTYARGDLPGVYGEIVALNRVKNHTHTPLVLAGSQGGKYDSNIISAYHARGGGQGNPLMAAAIWIGEASRRNSVRSNTFGGGINDMSASNNCQWGLFAQDQTATRFGGNDGNLGLPGGALEAAFDSRGTWWDPLRFNNTDWIFRDNAGKLRIKLGSKPGDGMDGDPV